MKEFEPEQLNARAQFVISQANELLQDPTGVQMHQNYTKRLDEDYSLEFRGKFSTYDNDEGGGSSRWFYIQGPHKTHCRPSYSLDINKLVNQQEATGLLDETDELVEILGSINVEPSAELSFARQVLALTEADIGVVNETFTDLLSQGTTFTRTSRICKLPEGSALQIIRNTTEGSYEHANPALTSEPTMRIELSRRGDDHHVVLEEHGPGLIETFSEIANPMLRMAAYAEEKDIHRAEDGRIRGVTTNGWDYQNIIAAERAAGVRDLSPEMLELFEQKIKLANTGS